MKDADLEIKQTLVDRGEVFNDKNNYGGLLNIEKIYQEIEEQYHNRPGNALR